MVTMYEALKNQVIDTTEETYLEDLKNIYTGFLVVTYHNLLKHLFDWYEKITTADIESNNQLMNKLIDLSLKIDKYFKQIDDCVQFYEDGNMTYTVA